MPKCKNQPAPPLLNGGVYQRGYRRFVLVYNPSPDEKCWGMLNIHRHCRRGMSAPLFQSNRYGEIWFSEDELREKCDADDWQLLDGRLRIEKIDDMSFVEYPTKELDQLFLEDIPEY